MKLILDFSPIVLFFAVYKFTNDLIVATLVLIPATLIQVVISYLMTKKVEPMPLVTLALVVILGGATVYLNDPVFIKWKPTLVNGLFVLAFFVSQYVLGKTVVERLMGSAVTLTAQQWISLNWAWIGFLSPVA